MRIAFLVALITSGLVLHVGRAQFLTGTITNPSNGHEYYLTATTNWTGAEALALTVGGHLATVRNSAENAWIFDTFAAYGGTDRFLWIGLSDAVATGQYLWTSGETADFRNWAIGEPNHLDGLDHYVEMYPANAARGPGYPPADPGTWNDAPDSSWPYQGSPSGNNFGPIFGVVEVVPEPSVWLLTTALAAIFVARIQFTRRNVAKGIPRIFGFCRPVGALPMLAVAFLAPRCFGQLETITLAVGSAHHVASYAVATNQIVKIVSIAGDPRVFPLGVALCHSSGTSVGITNIGTFTGLTNVSVAAPYKSYIVNGTNYYDYYPGLVTLEIESPATANVVSNYIPADAIVIPASATGNVQIILESSSDLVNWTAASPGTYGASAGTNRFFRVRGAVTP